MRLHSLQLQAFGPFAEPLSVDLDTLCAEGVFLLTGPTGAGKTSLLDAICFALYGSVPGRRQDAKQLKSDHADDFARPEVRLEVTLGGRRLRIRRTPTWHRRSSRSGKPAVRQNPTVLVEELVQSPAEHLLDVEGPTWHTRATHIGEAADFLNPLLGMNLDQFCQVVLLPQGSFATFLHAKSDDRRALLEKLFGAGIYTRLESWMAVRRTDLYRDEQAELAAIQQIRARIHEALHGTDYSGTDPAVHNHVHDEPSVDHPAMNLESTTELLPWLTDQTRTTGEQLAVAEAAVTAAENDWSDAEYALTRAQELDGLLGRYATARTRQDELLRFSTSAADQRAELEAARRASHVQPLLTAVLNARTSNAPSASAERAAREALLALNSDLADATVAQLDQALKGAERHAIELGVWSQQYRAHTDVATRLLSDDMRCVELSRQVDHVRGQAALLDADLQVLASVRDGHQSNAADAPAATLARSQASTMVAGWQTLDRVRNSVATSEQQANAALDLQLEAMTIVIDLRRRRLDGMAAELATGLEDGQPCSVCGSPDHPAPATAVNGTLITASDEQFAQDALTKATNASSEARAALDTLRGELKAALEHVGDLSRDQAEADFASAQSRLEFALGAVSALAQTEVALEHAKRDSDAAHAALHTQEAELKTLTDVIAATRTNHEREAQRLFELAGSAEQVVSDVDRNDHLVRALTTASSEAAAHARSAQELNASEIALAAALSDYQFGSESEAVSAVRTPAVVAELDQRVTQYSADFIACEQQLADPALSKIANVEAPAIDELLARRVATLTARDAAVGHRDQLRHTLGRLASLTVELTAAITRYTPVHEAYVRAAGLAQLLEGKSSEGTKMRLSAYVLAARLEQVVGAASRRLALMSGERFTLVHSEDASAGDRRGGLSIRVLDGWTGVERDPVTLSGGETFVASLALALGMADIVSAEVGGVDAATLFIDEGFGALDSDTLDEVLDVIDDLRAGGRVIGLVSHVEALRERVQARVAVHKGTSGSRVTQYPLASQRAQEVA